MTGRADVLDRLPSLADLAASQASVVSRSQLAGLEVSRFAIAHHLRARRWTEVVPGVLVLHRGPLLPEARAWVAVLAGGECAALCAWTTLELFGLEGWARPVTHLVVPRGRHVPDLPAVVVHESRRHTSADLVLRNGLPTHAVERAAVDAGAWAANARGATGVLAAVVQQGLTTAARVAEALDAAGRVRHRRQMMVALADIEGGSQALSELDFVRLCRRAGLPERNRQRVRTDARGRRRYLDAEWVLGNGRRVIVEVDGAHHREAQQWYDDLLRQSEVAQPGRDWVIRLPASALRLEPERVVAIVRRALRALAA